MTQKTNRKFKYLWFLSSLTLSIGYFAIVPPNAGPDEVVHARSSWYLYENPGKVFGKEFVVTAELPGELTISDTTHNFDHTACFTQQAQIQPKCQELKLNSDRSERFYIYYHSIPYYLFIGWAQHFLDGSMDAYSAAKLASFMLSWIVLFFAYRQIAKSAQNLSPILFSFLISASSIFLFSTVNPSSLEIVAAIYFASSILSLSSNPSKANKLHFTFSGVLLTLSRPLGFVWLLCLILYFQSTTKTNDSLNPVSNEFGKLLLPLGFLFSFQVWVGHDWPSPLQYPNPNIEFYFEEAIREFNESGHWYAHLFGILGAGEIKIPLLFLYLNFVAVLFLFKSTADQDLITRRRQYFVLILSLFFVPAAIQLANSAVWPVWWQGRYLIPVFIGLAMIHLARDKSKFLESSNWARLIVILGITSQTYLAIITFSRFNWGLYPTTTPIISNGWSISQLSTLIFVTCTFLFLVISLWRVSFPSFLRFAFRELLSLMPNLGNILRSLALNKHSRETKAETKHNELS